MHISYLLVALDNDRMKMEIAIQEEKLRLMETEYEHIRKLNAKLRREKNQALDSHHLFPHVFPQDSMPMYVYFNFWILYLVVFSRCTPDMDVIINYPQRRTPLPV
jgi:hypothetical protein